MSSTASSNSHPLVNFYDPAIQAKDSKGRTLNQILAWTDKSLEDSHDYIQILFPLPEGSIFNSKAPLINRVVFTSFRTRPELRANLQRSLERMLRFYGLELNKTGAISLGPNYNDASKNWVKQTNHNHLRITRIIRSLRVLGLENRAEQFFLALQGAFGQGGKIGDRSLMFWYRAAKKPLFIAPEDGEDRGKGADFLYEFEKGKMSSGGALKKEHIEGTKDK
ncbi:hypothetical protein ACLMJK_007501 [Lecanora helva]